MQISRFTLHTACLLLLMPALAGTQSGGRYDLMWSTVDGGSAVSAGGDYALDRTAGQPDAGTLSGSGFELSGGFWTIKVEIPTAARVIALVTQSPATNGIAAAILLTAFVGLRRMSRLHNDLFSLQNLLEGKLRC